MVEKVFTFDEQTAQRIVNAVNLIERLSEVGLLTVANLRLNETVLIEGVLVSALTAPPTPTSPTTSTMKVRYGSTWIDDGSGNKTVTNRDPSLSGVTGAYIIAILIGDEFRPIWIGCSNANYVG